MNFKRSVCVLYTPGFASSRELQPRCAEQTSLPEEQYRTFPGVSISAQDIVAARRVLRVALLWTRALAHTHTVDLLISSESRRQIYEPWCSLFLAGGAHSPPPRLHLGPRRFPADGRCNKSHVHWLCFTVDFILTRRAFRRWRLSDEAAMLK